MSVLHNQDVHLIDYLRVLYKRKFFILVVLMVAVGFGAWSAYRTPKMYSSKAQILLENEGTLVDFPGVRQFSLIRIDTEMHVMRSREVAEWAVGNRLARGQDRSDPDYLRLTDTLMNSTAVDVLRNTYIVEMTCRAPDPERARAWCEAMSEGYVAVNLEAKKASNAAAALAIQDEIQRTKTELQVAERRLLDFKTENNLVSDQSKAMEQSQLFGAGTQARAESGLRRVEFENKSRMLERWFLNNDFTLPLPADLAGTPLVPELYQQIVKKRIEYKTLLSRYREQHPKVQGVVADLDTLQRNFNQEVRSSLEVLRKQAEVWSSVGRAQEGQMEKAKSEFLKTNERDWQYKLLSRNVEALEEVYKALLQKLGEINVMTSIVKNNARIIERPKLNPVAFQPNWRLDLIAALVFGLGIAIGGVFFLEYFDKTLKTPDDIARYLNLPVLAVVPLARTSALRSPYQAPQLREGEAGAGTA